MFGGDIHTLETDKVGTKTLKTPDMLWNGKYWEYKDVKNKSSVNNRIRKAKSQLMSKAKRTATEDNPVGLVLDISKREINIEEMIAYVSQEVIRHYRIQVDIIIKENERLIKVLQKKK